MKKLLAMPWASKYDDVAWLFLRVVTGAIFAMHGYQKWQNGVEPTAGFVGSLGFPMPEVFAVLLIAAELLGGIALIVGAFTRFAAGANVIVALVALIMVHADQGFFVRDGGYEFVLLLLAATVLIMTKGGGKWSLDKHTLRLS